MGGFKGDVNEYERAVSERISRWHVRGLAQLIKLSRTISWREIATELADEDEKNWKRLLEQVDLDEYVFDEHEDQEIFELIRKMFDVDPAILSSISFRLVARKQGWLELTKKANDELLKEDFEFTVCFRQPLMTFAKTYADRTNANAYESNQHIIDYAIVYGEFSMDGATIYMYPSAEMEKKKAKG